MVEMNFEGNKGENENWLFEITEIDFKLGGYVQVFRKPFMKRTEIKFDNIKAGTKLLNGETAKYNEIKLIYKKSYRYPKYLLELIERHILATYHKMTQEVK